MEEKKSFWAKLREVVFVHTTWHFTGDKLLESLVGGTGRGLIVSAVWGGAASVIGWARGGSPLFIAIAGLIVFTLVMILWEIWATGRKRKTRETDLARAKRSP
jgi:hypothetical protein